MTSCPWPVIPRALPDHRQCRHPGTLVKKSKQAFFGYRGHAAVDSEDGYVEHVQVHPANEAEIKKLPQIIEALSPGVEAVLADKGYGSKANRQWLKERGIGDLIQHKGSAGKPVHPAFKAFNQKIGSIRFKVEQAFGTMKRRFHLARARCFGAAKVQAHVLGGTGDELAEGPSQAQTNGVCGGRCALSGANGAAKEASKQKAGPAGAENVAQSQWQ